MSKDLAANEKGSSFTECFQIAQGILVWGTFTVDQRLLRTRVKQKQGLKIG